MKTANQKQETNSSKRILLNLLTLIVTFKLIGITKLITWRTDRPDHWSYLYETMREALDKNQVFEGIKVCQKELMFNLVHFGSWLQFLILFIMYILIIKYTPQIYVFARNMTKKSREPLRFFGKCIREFISAVAAIHPLAATESVLRYNIIPGSSSVFTAVGISTTMDFKTYYGGIALNQSIVSVPRLHMIAGDGSETSMVLPQDLKIIRKKCCIYVCGNFNDSNGTKQRKIMLCEGNPAITITMHHQSFTLKAI